MTKKPTAGPKPSPDDKPVQRKGLRLPTLVKPEDRGLGDMVSRMAHSAGFTPCEGCQKRAATLNQWMPFKQK